MVDCDFIVQFLLTTMSGRLPSGTNSDGTPRYEDVSVPDRMKAAVMLADYGWGTAPDSVPEEEDENALGLEDERADEMVREFARHIDALVQRRAAQAERSARRRTP